MANTRAAPLTIIREESREPSWFEKMQQRAMAKPRDSSEGARRTIDRTLTVPVKPLLATTLGGVAGAVGSCIAVKKGIAPKYALGGAAILGVAGATLLKGNWRNAALGGVALAIGQAAISWFCAPKAAAGGTQPLAAQAKQAAQAAQPATKPRGDEDGGFDVAAAFRNAREQMDASEFDGI